MAVRLLPYVLLISLLTTRVDSSVDTNFNKYVSCANVCHCSRDKVSGKVLVKCNFAGKSLTEEGLLLPPDVYTL